MFTSVFIVAGNLLTIMLFAVNKRLRKKSIFLVIPAFRQALGLCCIRRVTAMNTERIERRNNMATRLTRSTELRRLRSDPGHLQQEDMDTKL